MAKAKSASAIAEDATLAREVARADYFTAFMRYGPIDKVRSEPLPTYEAARQRADEYQADSKFGRQAVVYAVNSLGSFPVDEELAKLAGLI